MLYPDIKNYLIELEEEKNEDELYLVDLEACSDIESLVQVVMEYHHFADEFEASNYILTKIA